MFLTGYTRQVLWSSGSSRGGHLICQLSRSPTREEPACQVSSEKIKEQVPCSEKYTDLASKASQVSMGVVTVSLQLLWVEIKKHFSGLPSGRKSPDLAEAMCQQ